LNGRDRAASIFAELAGNAAEHSLSEYGAFVAAQAYGRLGEIEIAVADVGIGIRAGLGRAEITSDEAAIRAALQEGVTGRRDAGGQLTEGGFGLPTAVAEAARLSVRSGTALVTTKANAQFWEASEEFSMVAPLDGTLVIADVSS
jgi:anti-sigma regulatory factor (Ser/Thr protein kinase)